MDWAVFASQMHKEADRFYKEAAKGPKELMTSFTSAALIVHAIASSAEVAVASHNSKRPLVNL